MNTALRLSLECFLTLALLAQGLFAANPTTYLVEPPYNGLCLAPDGKHIAMLVTDLEGKMTVQVVDTASLKVDPFDVSDGKGGNAVVTDMRWVDSERLVFLSDGADNANWLHLFKVGDKFPERLTKDGRRAIVATIPSSSRFLVAELPAESKVGTCRLLEYDVKDAQNPRVVYQGQSKDFECVTDRQGKLKLVKRQEDEGVNTAWHAVDEVTGTQTKLDVLKPWMRVYGLDGDSGHAVIAGHIDAAVPAIYVYDIAHDKTAHALTDHTTFSIERYGRMVFDGVTRKAVGLHLDTTTYASFWIDPELKALQATIDAKLLGSVNRIHAWSDDRSRLLVERIFPMLPKQFYYIEPTEDRYVPIVLNGGILKPQDVGPTRLVDIPNRDGVTLPCLLTMPPDAEPKKKLPLLLWVRKGVWTGLDRLEWHPEANFFASEGFVVLRVNYRGGEGMLGDLASDAGKKDGVLQLFRDLEDAAKALVDAGLVDGRQIMIGGEGEGAWAAAYAPIATPSFYRAIACFNGIYDLVSYHDAEKVDDVGAGLQLNFAQHYSSMSAADVVAFSVTQNIKSYPEAVFVAYGKWSPKGHKSQTGDFVKAAKKAGSHVKSFSEDWWGPQMRGIDRNLAFSRASDLLKSARK